MGQCVVKRSRRNPSSIRVRDRNSPLFGPWHHHVFVTPCARRASLSDWRDTGAREVFFFYRRRGSKWLLRKHLVRNRRCSHLFHSHRSQTVSLLYTAEMHRRASGQKQVSANGSRHPHPIYTGN